VERRRLLIVAAVLAIACLPGCSIRVRGVVTDKVTGDPIPACAIAIGPKKLQTRPDGRYIVSTYTDWHIITFDAPGYEPMKIDFSYSSDRDTIINAALERQGARASAEDASD